MSLKRWMLSGMNRVFTRADLPSRDAASHAGDDARNEPVLRPAPPRAGRVEHLGRYGPLIGAIRTELEEFVASQLRLHLAIAERDRYLLTSIEVESTGTEEARDLLLRFTREFTPEQIRHFVAKEIVARLPNASAIDLGQFAGLSVAGDVEAEDGEYAELMHELRSGEPLSARPYRVTLAGRWCEDEPRNSRERRPPRDAPATPLAGKEMYVEIEDTDGARRVALGVVAPGRHFVVGKDEGCDIVVNGVYASRRHCEIWVERGRWWASDSGSTNGIRVESPSAPARPGASRLNDGTALEVEDGMSLVLSASAGGSAREYPRLTLRTGADAHPNPDAAAGHGAPATPVTPIAVPGGSASAFTVTARMASGVRTLDLPNGEQPIRIGRSRNQALVIDWAHQGVSGHHIDILARDASGAAVVVHGDNGVSVDGTRHPPGTRFHWNVGQTMILGRAIHQEPECALTLARRDST